MIIFGTKPASLYINTYDLLKILNHISNPDVVNLLAVYISRLIFTLPFLERGADFTIKQKSWISFSSLWDVWDVWNAIYKPASSRLDALKVTSLRNLLNYKVRGFHSRFIKLFGTRYSANLIWIRIMIFRQFLCFLNIFSKTLHKKQAPEKMIFIKSKWNV